MKYLLLPILLTVLCFSGFTSQIQANGTTMSLEHGGTTDVKGSREFDVFVCNEFEVEFWIRDAPTDIFEINLYITWDPDLMELQNVELNLPSTWHVDNGPNEWTDLWYVDIEGLVNPSNWKWITFTFHCKGEGSSPINIDDSTEMIFEPGYGVPHTKLKAAVTQTIEPAPVGGLVTPTNKLDILTPYMALAGLIAAVSTVYVVKRRKD